MAIICLSITDTFTCLKSKIGVVFQSQGQMCGDTHWRAAKERSKTMRNQDETGLVMLSCRHSVLFQGLNMFQGEIFPYPMCLQQSHFVGHGPVKFVCQDVICKYWPWLQRVTSKMDANDSLQGLLNAKPFLSVVHGKAHSWPCQVTCLW